MDECIKNEIGTPIFYLQHCIKCYDFIEVKIQDCCHNPNVIQIHTQFSNDTIHKRNFCTNCYKIFKAQKKIPGERLFYLDKYRTEKAREFYTNYRTSFSKRKCEIFEKKHQLMRFNWEHKYQTYINSNEWKQKRKIILIRDKYICQICKINGAVQVHHLTYKRLGNEQLFDLISVCLDCHNKEHNQ
jgi:hypothetical protein